MINPPKPMGTRFFIRALLFFLTCLLLRDLLVMPTPKGTQDFIHYSNKGAVLNRLKLTGTQRNQIQMCRAAYRKRMAEIDAQLLLGQVKIQNELENENPNVDRLEMLCNRIGYLQGERLRMKIATDLTLERKILTPQQLEKFRVIQAKEELEFSNLI